MGTRARPHQLAQDRARRWRLQGRFERARGSPSAFRGVIDIGGGIGVLAHQRRRGEEENVAAAFVGVEEDRFLARVAGGDQGDTALRGFGECRTRCRAYRAGGTGEAERLVLIDVLGAVGVLGGEMIARVEDSLAKAMGAKATNSMKIVGEHYDLAHSTEPNTYGGAVMGTSPETSVVNPWLQHWDMPNLWVVGGSCFPQSEVQGTLTILATTYRAADALVDRYLKKPGALA